MCLCGTDPFTFTSTALMLLLIYSEYATDWPAKPPKPDHLDYSSHVPWNRTRLGPQREPRPRSSGALARRAGGMAGALQELFARSGASVLRASVLECVRPSAAMGRCLDCQQLEPWSSQRSGAFVQLGAGALVANTGLGPQRQRAGALQDAGAFAGHPVCREVSWSAPILPLARRDGGVLHPGS
jgi:hypothetical protein